MKKYSTMKKIQVHKVRSKTNSGLIIFEIKIYMFLLLIIAICTIYYDRFNLLKIYLQFFLLTIVKHLRIIFLNFRRVFYMCCNSLSVQFDLKLLQVLFLYFTHIHFKHINVVCLLAERRKRKILIRIMRKS